jgi:DNA-3-methyladenine glycosylase
LPTSLDVAPLLLGARLVHDDGTTRVVVRLTEVEAYTGELDPGSHAFRGLTPRTRVMFGPPGHLYVYFTYGMHWCANVVCGPEGEASAVLLRAGEVVEGIDVALARRPSARTEAELARGPARLTTALGIGREHNGADLCVPSSNVWLEAAAEVADGRIVDSRIVDGQVVDDDDGARVARVSTGPRVGLTGPGGDAATFPWRFWLAGEASVSAYRPGKPRRRPAAGDGRLS